jgi:electron transfer flavoprotein alpha subunit
LDCTSVAIDGDALVVTKPVNGGGVCAEFVMHGKPSMTTVRASAFSPRSPGLRVEPTHLDVAPSRDGRVTVLTEERPPASGRPRLRDAKIVVAGGRGIGGPEQWHFIEEASEVLGAAVGCSRPVADAGWVASSHQVGLSGVTVAPDLYIAVGISGAPQHLAGITGARMVVAINNSQDAEIFTRADYGVVADYRDVLPAFVERVKQLRS